MCQGYNNRHELMPNYEYIRTDNFLDLPTTSTMNEQQQPKSMNDEYNEIRKECIQRSFKSTQSSIKSSATSSSNANDANVQSQILMGSSTNNTTQRRRRSIDDNITNNNSSTNNNRLNKQNHRRHSISNNTSINNNSFVNSSQISNILQEHLLHSPTIDADIDKQQHKQSSAIYNTNSTPQNVHDAINLELQHRNNRRDGNNRTIQNRKSRRDSSTSPSPPTSELQRHLQRSTNQSNQSSSVVSQRRGNRQAGSSRHTSGGGSLRDSNATILHSNQRRRTNQGTLRDSNVTILHSNQQQKETQNSNQLGNNNGSRPKELVDSLQYSLDDSDYNYSNRSSSSDYPSHIISYDNKGSSILQSTSSLASFTSNVSYTMDINLANELFPVMNRGLDATRSGLDGSLESGYHGEGEVGSGSMNSSARSRSTKSSSSIMGASLQRDLPSHWTTTSESVLDIEQQQQLQTASMIPPRRINRTTTNDATLRESDKAYHSLMKLMSTNPNCLYDDNDKESNFVGYAQHNTNQQQRGRVATSSSYRRGSNADLSPLNVETSPSLSSTSSGGSSSRSNGTARSKRIKQCIRVMSILILLTVISILLIYLIDESLLNDISTNVLGRFVDVKEKKGSDNVVSETPHLVTETTEEEESRHREMIMNAVAEETVVEEGVYLGLNEEEQYALLLPGV